MEPLEPEELVHSHGCLGEVLWLDADVSTHLTLELSDLPIEFICRQLLLDSQEWWNRILPSRGSDHVKLVACLARAHVMNTPPNPFVLAGIRRHSRNNSQQGWRAYWPTNPTQVNVASMDAGGSSCLLYT